MNNTPERIGKCTLHDALELFDRKEYSAALSIFENLAEDKAPKAQLYGACCKFLAATPATAALLGQTWQTVLGLLEQTEETENRFAFAEEARMALALCTTALYRACNDRQMLEYGMLQKDVSFEKKEYVLREFQRVLKAADEDYRAVLTVIYGYAAFAVALSGKAAEEFYLGLLQYMHSAVSLQAEIGLSEEFDPLLLAKYACGLPLDPEMEEAVEERNKLLADALTTPDALKDWETFAPFAQAAGVKREVLEKEERKRQRIEKLKFWKEWIKEFKR